METVKTYSKAVAENPAEAGAVPKKIAAKRQRKNTGRPIENPAWDYYTYDESTGRTSCNYCTLSLKGKHTTNLIRHLARHPVEYAEYLLKEGARNKRSGRSSRISDDTRLTALLSRASEPITAKNVNVSLKRKSQCITIEIVTPKAEKAPKRKLKTTEVIPVREDEDDDGDEEEETGEGETVKGGEKQPQPDWLKATEQINVPSPVKLPKPIPTRPNVTKAQRKNIVDRNRKFRDILVEMVGTTSVPAQILENDVFRKLMKFLDPDISVPSRETLGREVIRTNSEIKKEMTKLIASAYKLTIGADVCAKKTVTCGFVGLVAYFYAKNDSKRYSLGLGLKELKNPQNTNELNSCISNILKEYGIEQRQIFRMITGGGGRLDSEGVVIGDEDQQASIYLNVHFCENNPQACNDSCCYASAIQFVSNERHTRKLNCFVNMLESVWMPHQRKSCFDDSVSAASKLIQYLSKAGAKVDYLLDDSGKSLKARKRWLPLFSKIEHLVKSKDTINQICLEERIELLSSFHWHRLDKFVALFSPFKVVKDQQTVSMESTISRVIPAIIFLQNHLSKQINSGDSEVVDLASRIVYEMNTKFDFLANPVAQGFDEIYLIATLLDPAVYKVLTHEQVILTMQLLENVYKTIYAEEANQQPAQITGDLNEREDEDENCFEQFLNSKSQETGTQNAILTKELNEYRDFALRKSVSTKTDPLEFWTSGEIDLPLLQKLALDILAVPSTANAVEQLFVMAGHASEGPKNARINGDTLESKVLLKYNRPFLNIFDE
ncbi:hypothetical protein HDE_04202 [Halotydeus destructor]|nr:hypothetical protein HDE_04202 [Halotydeus destructor]